MTEEEQSLYCTECGEMLRFKTKPEKNGKLIIVCDYCGHKHYRYVSNGIVSESRWDTGGRANKKFGVMGRSKE